jgi:transcriptional regulator with XRE-family HTH domain
MHKPPLTQHQIGRTIREARREQRLTQEELAFAAGLSTGTLHNIEHGKFSARVETLQRILSILGMTLEVTKRSARQVSEAPERSPSGDQGQQPESDA